jgi:hypothetical protein
MGPTPHHLALSWTDNASQRTLALQRIMSAPEESVGLARFMQISMLDQG